MAFDPRVLQGMRFGGRKNINNDVQVADVPSDTISSVKISSENVLSTTSWANDIRCWKLDRQAPSAKFVAKAELATPLLSSDWDTDGQVLFSGSCDVYIYMWTPDSQSQPVTLGKHESGVKCTKWSKEHNLLVTGSWDSSVKFWDLRKEGFCKNIELSDRCYTLDLIENTMVVYTADNRIHQYDPRKHEEAIKVDKSPIAHQSRCISLFPDQTGYALGSIEGRVAIHHIPPEMEGKNFKFKCHRQNDHVYSINQIAFHAEYGTFATCGSDGGFTFWDKDSKQRLRRFNHMNNAITDCCFSPRHEFFAYAVGYDWSRGSGYFDPKAKPELFLKVVADPDIRPKARRGQQWGR